ncbi:tetratricopeptide repeat protein [Mesorhizobium yinganensis]|uniref:tetratricopeptide repeat protein n=1 Tax=Mesorhizobium yinganensis TaxID=3157707 RepID=UPI0032B7868F
MTKLFGLLSAVALLAAASAVAPLPAYAVDDLESSDAPDLTSVRAKIDAKDYQGALTELRDLAQDVQQPDVYNLLGFTLRQTGDYQTSLTYYQKALELRPDFKAAHEYLGELYVETGDMKNAQMQLASLQQLCPGGCDELEDLQKAINANATK